MALRLHAVNLWAVSGTPVAKNRLDDIYGLLLFLDQAPWSHKQTFSSFFDSRHAQLPERVRGVFNEVMWRSTKVHPGVKEQLNIPDMKEEVHYCDFSPVERAVYDRGFREIHGEVHSLLSSLESRASVRRSAIDSVTTYIARLRATCSHPTVGAHGMQRSQRQRKRIAAQADKKQEKEKEKRERPMTMAQIGESVRMRVYWISTYYGDSLRSSSRSSSRSSFRSSQSSWLSSR